MTRAMNDRANEVAAENCLHNDGHGNTLAGAGSRSLKKEGRCVRPECSIEAFSKFPERSFRKKMRCGFFQFAAETRFWQIALLQNSVTFAAFNCRD